ncbi:cation transporter [Brevibacillus dissolubilis]|uniref:cation transporter n=1 Tax=Brevibacillus dissolubilis TaxID=1844116 RepID=UPI001117ABB6|nr:cation transporter [Brevibacillus dissolubilis]
MTQKVLKVEGMSCGHCVATIEGSLAKELGVTSKVNLANKEVTVEYDEARTSIESIKTLIENQGYDLM